MSPALEGGFLTTASPGKSPNVVSFNTPIFQYFFNYLNIVRKIEFPGGAVVKIPCFHCRGHGFDPTCHREHQKNFVRKTKREETEDTGRGRGIHL